MNTPPSLSIEFRVQYYETDGQGRVHHGQYINYFERGRVELLRFHGHSYREFEESGFYLVVSELNVKYLGAAVFDDQLCLTTTIEETRGVRIRHSYELTKLCQDKPPETIVTANSTVACIDKQGKVRPLPKYLRSL